MTAENKYTYMLWKGIKAVTNPTRYNETWAEITEGPRFSRHEEIADKEAREAVTPADALLTRRHDSQVRALTMAFWDADTGTPADVERCRTRIASEGLAAHWYTSYSHTPDVPKWRLILPFSEPVLPSEWGVVRGVLHSRLSIPADVKKCGGLSHAYYLPSCPAGGKGEVFRQAGRPLDVGPLKAMAAPRTNRPALSFETPGVSSRPPRPPGPMDLGPQKDALRQRANNLVRRSSEPERTKGEGLRKLLAGEPLAEKGHRDQMTTILAGVVAAALPSDVPVEVLFELFRPSLIAMQAAGSKLTESEVLKKLERAVEWVDQKRAEEAAELEAVRAWLHKGSRRTA